MKSLVSSLAHFSSVGRKGVKEGAARDVGNMFAVARSGLQMLRMW